MIGCEICDIRLSAELSCFIVLRRRSFQVLGRRRHRKRPPKSEEPRQPRIGHFSYRLSVTWSVLVSYQQKCATSTCNTCCFSAFVCTSYMQAWANNANVKQQTCPSRFSQRRNFRGRPNAPKVAITLSVWVQTTINNRSGGFIKSVSAK